MNIVKGLLFSLLAVFVGTLIISPLAVSPAMVSDVLEGGGGVNENLIVGGIFLLSFLAQAFVLRFHLHSFFKSILAIILAVAIFALLSTVTDSDSLSLGGYIIALGASAWVFSDTRTRKVDESAASTDA